MRYEIVAGAGTRYEIVAGAGTRYEIVAGLGAGTSHVTNTTRCDERDEVVRT